MSRNLIIKMTLDVVMTALMLVAMAYRITGDLAHEIVGISLFAMFAAHNILNRTWYRSIWGGKYTVRRALNTAVNLLLIIVMTVLMVTGILISRNIFTFLPISGDFAVRQIHTLAAWWGLILIGVHLGMHWEMILGAARKMAGITGASRVRTVLLRILAALIIIHGARVSFDRDVGAKLILYYSFDFWDSSGSIIAWLMGTLSIMGVYVFGTHYMLKFITGTKTNMPRSTE